MHAPTITTLVLSGASRSISLSMPGTSTASNTTGSPRGVCPGVEYGLDGWVDDRVCAETFSECAPDGGVVRHDDRFHDAKYFQGGDDRDAGGAAADHDRAVALVDAPGVVDVGVRRMS